MTRKLQDLHASERWNYVSGVNGRSAGRIRPATFIADERHAEFAIHDGAYDSRAATEAANPDR